MAKDVIIALDFIDRSETLAFLKPFEGQESLYVKIGLALYLQAGQEVVSEIQAQGHRIFLDLKLHDIPNTVYETTRGLARMKLDLLTVHAAGGVEMMTAALNGMKDGGSPQTEIIAVTQLTSTSQENMQKEQLVTATLEESVLHYASLAKAAGLHGVVSSVHETETIKKHFGAEFLSVAPGIRTQTDVVGDQKRVATPETARIKGVDYIVVGRPITTHPNPVEAYQTILTAFKG